MDPTAEGGGKGLRSGGHTHLPWGDWGAPAPRRCSKPPMEALASLPKSPRTAVPTARPGPAVPRVGAPRQRGHSPPPLPHRAGGCPGTPQCQRLPRGDAGAAWGDVGRGGGPPRPVPRRGWLLFGVQRDTHLRVPVGEEWKGGGGHEDTPKSTARSGGGRGSRGAQRGTRHLPLPTATRDRGAQQPPGGAVHGAAHSGPPPAPQLPGHTHGHTHTELARRPPAPLPAPSAPRSRQSRIRPPQRMVGGGAVGPTRPRLCWGREGGSGRGAQRPAMGRHPRGAAHGAGAGAGAGARAGPGVGRGVGPGEGLSTPHPTSPTPHPLAQQYGGTHRSVPTVGDPAPGCGGGEGGFARLSPPPSPTEPPPAPGLGWGS